MFCPESNYYIIKPDDTLYKISSAYHLSPDDLIASNSNINPDQLVTGDTILLPLVPPINACPHGTTLYNVKPGDTFYSISKQFNIKISALIRANSKVNPDAMLIGQNLCIPKPWNFYSNAQYGVTFQYPYRWSKFGAARYEGIDGFFQIAAVSCNDTIDTVCMNEAFHRLKPYGSHPTISQVTVDSKDACLILPSTDQPMEMKEQSALIFRYPKPIQISEKTYHYFILWANKKHIEDIIHTLRVLAE